MRIQCYLNTVRRSIQLLNISGMQPLFVKLGVTKRNTVNVMCSLCLDNTILNILV